MAKAHEIIGVIEHEVDSEKQFDPGTIIGGKVLPITSLGEGLKIVKRDIVNFNKAFATKVLEMDVFGPDRAEDDRHVNKLLDAMKRGTFRWEHIMIKICTCNGKTYRMDGQHTAWARLYFDEAPHNLAVQVLRYSAKSENDLRMLYASIDRGKPRTKGNVINSYLYQGTEFGIFNKSVIRQIAEGLSFWLWDKETSLHDGDEIAYLLRTEYLGLALSVGHFLANSQTTDTRHLRRSPVYAAIYATFQKSESAAKEFWYAVKVGSNLEPQDPRLKLRNHLMTHAINAGRGGGSYKKGVSGNDMYGWCIQAWNASRDNKKLGSFRMAGPKRLKPV